MRRLAALALAVATAVLALAGPARAELPLNGMSDAQFTAEYFGTTLVFTSPTQLDNYDLGTYWSDKLPQELLSNHQYLIGVVNAARMSAGQPLLNPAEYLISIGWETPNGSAFEYHIDFMDMTPSDVDRIIGALGGEGKMLPGTALSVRPLTMRSFYASSTEGSTVTLPFGGQTMNIDVSGSLATARNSIAQALKQRYGKDVAFSLYLTQSDSLDGVESYDVSVYCDMNYTPGMYDAPVG
jgi:hypothetical protein